MHPGIRRVGADYGMAAAAEPARDRPARRGTPAGRDAQNRDDHEPRRGTPAGRDAQSRDEQERRRTRRVRRVKQPNAGGADERAGRRRERGKDDASASRSEGDDEVGLSEEEKKYLAETQRQLETPRPYQPEGFGDEDLATFAPAFPVGGSGLRHFGGTSLRRLVEPLETGHGLPLCLRRNILATSRDPNDLPFGSERLKKTIAEHEAQLARPGLYEPTKLRLAGELEDMKRQLPFVEKVDDPVELAKRIAAKEAMLDAPGISQEARRGLVTELEGMKGQLRHVKKVKDGFRPVLEGRYRSSLDGGDPALTAALRVAFRNDSYSEQDEMVLKKKIASLLAAPKTPAVRSIRS